MNLILLSDPDFITQTRVRLTDRRFTHIQEILKAENGQSLTVGKINGLIGQGEVVGENNDSIELEVKLDQKPPEVLPLTLILALPRPPMLKRILFSAAMLGVKKIIILNFNRVEKSLWNSSSLKPEVISEQLILGLEQAKDTIMPEVIIKKGFKPFVQDELPQLIQGKQALVAHPDKTLSERNLSFPNIKNMSFLNIKNMSFLNIKNMSFLNIKNMSFPNASVGNLKKNILLIIGPEGGIIDYEIETLKSAGCQLIDLGPRILRTEAVLPYIVGKLF